MHFGVTVGSLEMLLNFSGCAVCYFARSTFSSRTLSDANSVPEKEFLRDAAALSDGACHSIRLN